MKLKLFGLAIITAVAFSCASKSAVTSASPASTPPVTPEVSTTVLGKPLSSVAAPTPPKDTKGVIAVTPAALESGKIAYENNCAKCHRLFGPKEYSREQWAPILVSMQKKAHLTDVEMAPITNYIYTQL